MPCSSSSACTAIGEQSGPACAGSAASVPWTSKASALILISSPVQQHRRSKGQRQAQAGGTVEALAPPEDRGERIQQQAQRAGDREDDDGRDRLQCAQQE